MNQFFTVIKKFCVALGMALMASTTMAAPISIQDDSPFTTLMSYETDRRVTPVLLAINAGDLPGARETLDALLEERQTAVALEVDGVLSALEGKIERAKQSLQRAVIVDPRRASALAKLGVLALDANEIEEARRLFVLTLRISRNEPLANRFLGKLALDENDVELATVHYERAVAGLPREFTRTHGDLIRLYIRTARYDEALVVLDNLDAAQSGEVEAIALYASAHLALGDAKQAASYVSLLESLNDDYPGLGMFKAVVARETGELEVAETAFRAMLRDDSQYASAAHFELGRTLQAAGRTDEALTEMRKAQKLEDQNLQIGLGISELLLTTGDTNGAYDELDKLEQATGTPAPLFRKIQAQLLREEKSGAIMSAEQAVTSYPDYLRSHLLLTEAYRSAGQFDLAVNASNLALEKFPGSVVATRSKAGTLMAAGRLDDAIAFLESALSENANNSALLFQLGNLYESANRMDDAAYTYQKVLRQVPDHVPSLNNLALIFANDSETATAGLESASKAFAIQPNSAAILDTYGWLLHVNGQNSEARKQLLAARQLAPNDAAVACHLGAVYAATAQRNLAQDAFDDCRALGADPASLKLLEKYRSQ